MNSYFIAYFKATPKQPLQASFLSSNKETKEAHFEINLKQPKVVFEIKV